ncbi:MAG: SpoIVB peptidase S55 [Acidobacteriaceae bacterium]
MPLRLGNTVLLALLSCAVAGPLSGQVSAWTPLPVPPPPTVSDASSIFPLADVRAGMHGIAWTVFQGTQPEAMQVEILGVLHDAIGPGQDMILARLRGTKPEYSGVVAGMSGSPVYIDGKLLGALAYRIGQFTKEPIAGITPIEQMLHVKDEGVSAALRRSRNGSTEAEASDTPKSPAGPLDNETGYLQAPSSAQQPFNSQTQNVAAPSTQAAGTELGALSGPSLLPIETPLVFNGFSPETLRLLGGHFTALGMEPVAGLGGASPEAKQPQPIVPGSAVSAVLVRGDLSMAATCTVTYVDPTQLLACGHPITQFGGVSMPMTKADVVLTLASPLNSFKIINTTETVGSFTEDRMNAIYGRFGETARMIPVTVSIIPPAEEPSSGGSSVAAAAKPRVFHFEVLNNAKLTPQVMLVSVYQALQQNNISAAEESYRMTGSLQIAGHSTVDMSALLAPNDQLPAALQAALLLNDRFGRIYGNDMQAPDVRSLDLRFQAIPKRLSADLESARVSSPEALPGSTVTVEATLRPYRGASTTLRIPVKLPESLAPGTLRLLVSDAATLDRLLQPAPFMRQAAEPLDATITQINREHADDRIYVTLLEHLPQAVLQDQALPSLPLSMANVLQPLRNSQRLSLTSESVDELGSAATGHVPSGSQVLTITVRSPGENK